MAESRHSHGPFCKFEQCPADVDGMHFLGFPGPDESVMNDLSNIIGYAERGQSRGYDVLTVTNCDKFLSLQREKAQCDEFVFCRCVVAELAGSKLLFKTVVKGSHETFANCDLTASLRQMTVGRRTSTCVPSEFSVPRTQWALSSSSYEDNAGSIAVDCRLWAVYTKRARIRRGGYTSECVDHNSLQDGRSSARRPLRVAHCNHGRSHQDGLRRR